MKLLITGYKGFIGSNLVAALEKQHQVYTHDWNDSQINLNNIDWVIHVGAISSTTERDVDKIMRQNYDFSCQLLDNCLDNGVHFQYASSASVYGLNLEFTENSPVDPRTPYAWSKYMFERYAAKRQEFANWNNYRIQGFRYFNVYGNGEDHKGSQASPVTQFRQQAQDTGKIKLFYDSDQYVRDFISVDDLCNVHSQFFDVKQSGVWNVGTGKPCSFQHIANLVSKKYNAEIEYVKMPDILKDSYQKYTCADVTKLEDAIGTQRMASVESWLL